MTDIPIPFEAVEAGAKASYQEWREDCSYGAKEPIANWREWAELDQDEQADWRGQARACFTAMVNAWPGMTEKQPDEHVALFNAEPALILPLTTPPAGEPE